MELHVKRDRCARTVDATGNESASHILPLPELPPLALFGILSKGDFDSLKLQCDLFFLTLPLAEETKAFESFIVLVVDEEPTRRLSQSACRPILDSYAGAILLEPNVGQQ